MNFIRCVTNTHFLQVHGLCGNMDGLAENDMISMTGIETTVTEFGNSFRSVACTNDAAVNQNFDPCMIQSSVSKHIHHFV